jgi:hypothetical protein
VEPEFLVATSQRSTGGTLRGDPWEEVIGPWLENRQSTAISEVLERCINKPQA